MTEEALTKLSISSECLEEQAALFNSSGHTKIKEVKCNYTWTVHSFSLSPEETGQYLTSPTFSTGTNDKYQWCLQLYPKGINQENKNYISLFLQLVSEDKWEVNGRLIVSILNKMGERTYIEPSAVQFNMHVMELGWPKFILIDALEKKALLSDDKLTIHCEISEIRERVNIPDHSTAMQVIIPECRLLDDLTLIFEKQKFSDVTLVVKVKEFQAHKAILAARSPVFEAMFEHELQEKKDNRIEIIDIDSEVVLELLRFMYTGKVMNLENIAIDLLVAADKYALERLKFMCEDVLCRSKPTVEDAVKILIIADRHGARQLKAHVKQFIIMNSKDVIATADWKSMVQTLPCLVEEMFIAATQ